MFRTSAKLDLSCLCSILGIWARCSHSPEKPDSASQLLHWTSCTRGPLCLRRVSRAQQRRHSCREVLALDHPFQCRTSCTPACRHLREASVAWLLGPLCSVVLSLTFLQRHLTPFTSGQRCLFEAFAAQTLLRSLLDWLTRPRRRRREASFDLAFPCLCWTALASVHPCLCGTSLAWTLPFWRQAVAAPAHCCYHRNTRS